MSTASEFRPERGQVDLSSVRVQMLLGSMLILCACLLSYWPKLSTLPRHMDLNPLARASRLAGHGGNQAPAAGSAGPLYPGLSPDATGSKKSNPSLESWQQMCFDLKCHLMEHWNAPDGDYGPSPLASATVLADFWLWRAEPASYHLVNAGLLFASCLMISLITLEITGKTGNRLGAGPAIWAGLLFAVQPLNAQSLSWIAARAYLLCLFFYLAAIFCYLRFRLARQQGFLRLCLLCIFLALASCRLAVTLPVVLGILELCFMLRFGKQLIGARPTPAVAGDCLPKLSPAHRLSLRPGARGLLSGLMPLVALGGWAAVPLIPGWLNQSLDGYPLGVGALTLAAAPLCILTTQCCLPGAFPLIRRRARLMAALGVVPLAALFVVMAFCLKAAAAQEDKSGHSSTVPAKTTAPLQAEVSTLDELTSHGNEPAGDSGTNLQGQVAKVGTIPTELSVEPPITAEMVAKYVEPFVWVRIPKAFAGVWETRTESVFTPFATMTSISGGAQIQNGTTRERNDQAVNGEMQVVTEGFRPGRQPIITSGDAYRFVRGLQMDSSGNIWDCPSLRNIQYHRKTIGPISQDLNGAGLSLTWNVRREVSSDSLVNAKWTLGGEMVSLPEYKIADFTPLDSWNGIDLKSAFQKFQQTLSNSGPR